MNIIFDLDGTIIDASDRMYILFNDIAPGFGFSKDEYWNLKRNKINHKMIFEMAGKSKDFNLFHSIWMERIENEKYLKYDKLYPNVNKNMKMLAESNNLVLLTARQDEKKLKQELYQLDLNVYFSEILIADEKSKKESILKKFLESQEVETSTIYISDMGQDISVGNKLGIKTIAITYGFMNEERLMEYNPNYIVRDISSVVDIITQL